MTPKNERPHVEIAGPLQQPRKTAEEMLKDAVERHVAETLYKREAFILEPFLRSKKVADEIRRLQMVPEWFKFSDVFKLRGCLDCKTKEARHQGACLCERCYKRFREQLRAAVERRLKKYSDPQYQNAIRDSEGIARQALFGDVNALTPAPLPKAERLYRTRGATARAAGIDESTLRDWIRKGIVGPPESGVWNETDIEELKAIKERNASLHNSKASRARWSKKGESA